MVPDLIWCIEKRNTYAHGLLNFRFGCLCHLLWHLKQTDTPLAQGAVLRTCIKNPSCNWSHYPLCNCPAPTTGLKGWVHHGSFDTPMLKTKPDTEVGIDSLPACPASHERSTVLQHGGLSHKPSKLSSAPRRFKSAQRAISVQMELYANVDEKHSLCNLASLLLTLLQKSWSLWFPRSWTTFGRLDHSQQPAFGLARPDWSAQYLADSLL